MFGLLSLNICLVIPLACQPTQCKTGQHFEPGFLKASLSRQIRFFRVRPHVFAAMSSGTFRHMPQESHPDFLPAERGSNIQVYKQCDRRRNKRSIRMLDKTGEAL